MEDTQARRQYLPKEIYIDIKALYRAVEVKDILRKYLSVLEHTLLYSPGRGVLQFRSKSSSAKPSFSTKKLIANFECVLVNKN